MNNNPLFKNIRYIYHNAKYGIKNLFKYFLVIWNDRNFDYIYLYTILHKKLENMEIFFNSENVSVDDAKDIAQEIKIVKDCIERLIENKYVKYLNEYFDEQKDYNHYNDNFSNLYNYAEFYRKSDKKFVFEFMNKKIERWWD